jgi:Holliday junction resolvase RusA-like endonuclease
MEEMSLTAYRATLPRRSEESDGQMATLTVIVPILPPTANHMYKPNGRGGKLLTDEAITFRAEIAVEVREVVRLTGWRMPAGPLQLTLLLTFGTRARRLDIDNRIKSAQDALALALGFDDSRIDRIVIERVGVDPKRPLCEMILEGL